MNTTVHTNALRLRAVAQSLTGLQQQVVFVGGATVALYADAPELADVRPTEDVDVLVELASYGAYGELDERLRQLGFVNDTTSGVVCRYRVKGITVDVMPTDPRVLGFSNRWYPEGFRSAFSYPLDQQTTIQLFTLPYFVASKWEATKARGGNDLRLSSDFEDIVCVLDQVATVQAQLEAAPLTVRTYLRAEFSKLLQRPGVEECVYAHLPPRFAPPRTTRLLELLTNFCTL